METNYHTVSGGKVNFGSYKSNTSHLISNSTHPLATTNKAIHCLKWGEFTKATVMSYTFCKDKSDAPNDRFFNLFLIRNAYNFDKSPKVCIHRNNFACNI